MEKIVLKSGQEFEIENIFLKDEKTLRFIVNGVTDYNEMKAKFTKEAISDVKAYTGEIMTGDYGCFNKLGYPLTQTEQENGTMNVTVTLLKDDEILQRLMALEDAVDTLILSELGVL